jgi:hypothetical protein
MTKTDIDELFEYRRTLYETHRDSATIRTLDDWIEFHAKRNSGAVLDALCLRYLELLAIALA